MTQRTSIEWTDATWNPIRGCSRVSEGCRNCYAERIAARFGQNRDEDTTPVPYSGLAFFGISGEPHWTGEIRVVEELITEPLRWKKPRRVFVNSMSDLFHEGVTDATLDRIFAVMALCPQHTFQVLTKRPERMREYLTRRPSEDFTEKFALWVANAVGDPCAPGWLEDVDWPLPNVWLGVSVEDQATADQRIPELLATPAAVRFVSAEPLLGAVDLARYMWPVCGWWTHPHKSYDEAKAAGGECGLKRQALVHADSRFLDWVIVGGESGPGARPMHPDWARSLRDQCQAAGVPFFFKQWGEWLPASQFCDYPELLAETKEFGNRWRGAVWTGPSKGWEYDVPDDEADPPNWVCRVGKKRAGRLLDGREWNEMPHEAREAREVGG